MSKFIVAECDVLVNSEAIEYINTKSDENGAIVQAIIHDNCIHLGGYPCKKMAKNALKLLTKRLKNSKSDIVNMPSPEEIANFIEFTNFNAEWIVADVFDNGKLMGYRSVKVIPGVRYKDESKLFETKYEAQHYAYDMNHSMMNLIHGE